MKKQLIVILLLAALSYCQYFIDDEDFGEEEDPVNSLFSMLEIGEDVLGGDTKSKQQEQMEQQFKEYQKRIEQQMLELTKNPYLNLFNQPIKKKDVIKHDDTKSKQQDQMEQHFKEYQQRIEQQMLELIKNPYLNLFNQPINK